MYDRHVCLQVSLMLQSRVSAKTIFHKTGYVKDLIDRNEIFGPVLTVVHADTLDDAIEIINKNK